MRRVVTSGGLLGFLVLGFFLLSTIVLSSVAVADNTDRLVPALQQSDSVTSGFLGQLLVEMNVPPAEESEYYTALIEEHREINEDVRGWIDIPDFSISYPVLYSTDNKAYLRHNIYGDYDIAGCIYLDANYGNIYSPMKLIHGHNMKNGTMFGELPQMLKWDSLDDAPLIYYCDDSGLKTFKIFSVFSVHADEESVIISEYSSLQELQDLKDIYLERSWVPVGKVPDSLEMLMLNTCWYGKSGTERRLHCIAVACRI